MVVRMTYDEIEKSIKDKLAMAPSLGVTFKFDFGDDGAVFVDGTQTPAVVSREGDDAETTVICSKETFKKILEGALDPTMAFMTGKVKIKGSMGNVTKLSSFLEG